MKNCFCTCKSWWLSAFFVLFFSESFSALPRLEAYPAPAGAVLNKLFTVKVRLAGQQWQPLPTYEIKVDKVMDLGHKQENAAMSYFSFEGQVEVAVQFNGGTVRSARIRPLSYDIPFTKRGNTLYFVLTRARNLSVEVNGDIFHNLHLFANPLEEESISPADKDVIYFGPGIHEIKGNVLKVPSGKTVYLAGGAILKARVLFDSVQNARLLGRGMVEQSIRGGVSIEKSSNISVNGVFCSQCFTGGSRNVTIRNVKSISYFGWGDGMNVISSNDVLIDGVFNRNSDDCTTVYGTRGRYTGGCRNVTMQNATLWADVAHPVLIGTHGNTPRPDTLQDLQYLNIDILDHKEAQIDYQGCMSINAGDNNLVRNVRFENIRVEDFRQGQLFNIRVFFNEKYCTSPGRGVENVLFKDIVYNGKHAATSVIAGYNESRKVKNIIFDNLTINGVAISDNMKGKPGWYKTGDMAGIYVGNHVEGVLFRKTAFAHPGILHGRADLERMREAVMNKKEPVYAGYKKFMQDPASQFTYTMQGPMEMVGRNPTVGQMAYDNDANAAHQNAVMWAITRDKKYADKAIEIINAWSGKLRSVTGRDAVLMAGLGPFKMVNAAEIIRYTEAGWKERDIIQAERHFREVIYPVIKDFAPFANGNWDAAAIKTVMAIGVFCNDRDMFEQALRYYTNGRGNGSLPHYVTNEAGQIQESGRDQPHSQLGIGMLAESCAIAWNQGLDLYAYAGNRLLKGFEYTAKYNMGNDDMPFMEWLDRTGKYHHTEISEKGRGQLRAVYEQVYNHYVITRGLSAPYVQQAAEKLRPEGPGRPGADHPGYGTLYFSLPGKIPEGKPAAPAGLIAAGVNGKIDLSWVAVIGASQYTVKRATAPAGPFTVLAAGNTGNRFTDTNVKEGQLYYYTVTASNAKGESAEAFPQAAMAGLPAPWAQADIGAAPAGSTLYDGQRFTISANGMGVDGKADGFHYTYIPLKGDGSLTVRLAPQPGSQFSQMGLLLRQGLAQDAPLAALLLYPGPSGQVEAPDWHTRLLVRAVAGAPATLQKAGEVLKTPAVTYGRLTGYYWLRLQRKGRQCKGYVSYDGEEWAPAGDVDFDPGETCMLGIAVGSGMANSTTVVFDQVSLQDGSPHK
jgi:hypothetical protein